MGYHKREMVAEEGAREIVCVRGVVIGEIISANEDLDVKCIFL